MYSKITTNLMVGSVNESLDFYEGVLGFSLVLGVPEGSRQMVTTRESDTPLGFAVIRRDDVELMLQSRKSLSEEFPAWAEQPIGGSITIYIQVTDAGELYEDIRDTVTIVKDLHATFYGTEEFYIRDCNGYVLTFASQRKEPAA